MRSTENIGVLIAAHMSAPGNVAEQIPDGDFILSSLRTAIFSKLIIRRKILTDVADVLGCQAEDLEFLYTDVNGPSHATQPRDVSFPDFRTKLMAAAE